MADPLHVAFVASEVAPFMKTGGLADVAAALPKALGRLGHRVTIFLPRYGPIAYPAGTFAGSVHVPVDATPRSAGFYRRALAPNGGLMRINLTSVLVDDQDKALRFYTKVLGFSKKADFSNGPYRWLTVVSPEEPDGSELQLALNDNPAAKDYQQALFQQGQSALMLNSADIKGDCERIKAQGGELSMPPTEVTGATIARLNDTCGNWIQLTQLR